MAYTHADTHTPAEKALGSLEGGHQRLEVLNVGRRFAQLPVNLNDFITAHHDKTPPPRNGKM